MSTFFIKAHGTKSAFEPSSYSGQNQPVISGKDCTVGNIANPNAMYNSIQDAINDGCYNIRVIDGLFGGQVPGYFEPTGFIIPQPVMIFLDPGVDWVLHQSYVGIGGVVITDQSLTVRGSGWNSEMIFLHDQLPIGNFYTSNPNSSLFVDYLEYSPEGDLPNCLVYFSNVRVVGDLTVNYSTAIPIGATLSVDGCRFNNCEFTNNFTIAANNVTIDTAVVANNSTFATVNAFYCIVSNLTILGSGFFNINCSRSSFNNISVNNVLIATAIDSSFNNIIPPYYPSLGIQSASFVINNASRSVFNNIVIRVDPNTGTIDFNNLSTCTLSNIQCAFTLFGGSIVNFAQGSFNSFSSCFFENFNFTAGISAWALNNNFTACHIRNLTTVATGSNKATLLFSSCSGNSWNIIPNGCKISNCRIDEIINSGDLTQITGSTISRLILDGDNLTVSGNIIDSGGGATFLLIGSISSTNNISFTGNTILTNTAAPTLTTINSSGANADFGVYTGNNFTSGVVITVPAPTTAPLFVGNTGTGFLTGPINSNIVSTSNT